MVSNIEQGTEEVIDIDEIIKNLEKAANEENITQK